MKKIFLAFAFCFKWLWKLLSTGIRVLSNLFFLAMALLLITLFLYRPQATVPDHSALVLSLEGDIVEQRSPIDPMARAINNLAGIPIPEESFLQDITDSIYSAADDDRISLLVISTHLMGQAGLNQIQSIGKAIEYFKQSGKKVLAVGDTFNQPQYYLASWADEIYLNPMGGVDLRGFGLFRIYLRELLEKLDINLHVFKVGTFKSALEPFTRDNMSPAAKTANRQWLENVWTQFSSDIAQHRNISNEQVNDAIDRLEVHLRQAQGDRAQMALNLGLVDGIKTRQQFRDLLADLVEGASEMGAYNRIDYQDYLTTITPSYSRREADEPMVGIIVARGNIVYGKGTVNQIGAAPLMNLIKKARNDSQIKALVLRIDTGGGSAFASELIRQELLLTQQAGKPVVISMGATTASGGYWLAVDADLILASPMTLTGSIGIFGAMPTFEKSLAHIGIHSDGVATNTTAQFGNPVSAMSSREKEIFQIQVEEGYSQFLNIVARGRDMSRQQVEEVAEGRVWDGATAAEIGLVDQLGDLDDAVAAASKLAGIPGGKAVYVSMGTDSLEHLFKRIGKEIKTLVPFLALTPRANRLDEQLPWEQYSFLLDRTDPGSLYAHSLLPERPLSN